MWFESYLLPLCYHPLREDMGESTSKIDDVALDSQLTPDALSLDILFDALANQRRRIALRCLGEFRTPMALADLADEIVTRERDSPLSDIPAEEVKQVYMSLYHTHIPKLTDANIVEYSQEQDSVEFSAERKQVEMFLDRVADTHSREILSKRRGGKYP